MPCTRLSAMELSRIVDLEQNQNQKGKDGDDD
jgi:hypothetical protein